MDVDVDWDFENNICDTGEKHPNYSRKATQQVGHTSSLQQEVDMNCSQKCSSPCSSAGPPGKQELLAELQWEDKGTCKNFYQKRGESTAGVFVPSSTNFEDKDLEGSKKPQKRVCDDDDDDDDDNENTILANVVGEDLELTSGETLPYGCKKCGSSFQDLNELQKHKQTDLLENSYQCPFCAKEFSRAANLCMHKLIHSSDRPHKCPECDKGFIRTVWRHLPNVHKIQHSMVILGKGTARNPWSTAHRTHRAGQYPEQPCLEDQKPEEEEDDCKPYTRPTCGKSSEKPNLLSKHEVIQGQDKPSRCEERGMACGQLLRLERHHQTRSGERPFCCGECGGTCTRLASLQCHLRIPGGEKPFSCSLSAHPFTPCRGTSAPTDWTRIES